MLNHSVPIAEHGRYNFLIAHRWPSWGRWSQCLPMQLPSPRMARLLQAECHA